MKPSKPLTIAGLLGAGGLLSALAVLLAAVFGVGGSLKKLS